MSIETHKLQDEGNQVENEINSLEKEKQMERLISSLDEVSTELVRKGQDNFIRKGYSVTVEKSGMGTMKFTTVTFLKA